MLELRMSLCATNGPRCVFVFTSRSDLSCTSKWDQNVPLTLTLINLVTHKTGQKYDRKKLYKIGRTSPNSAFYSFWHYWCIQLGACTIKLFTVVKYTAVHQTFEFVNAKKVLLHMILIDTRCTVTLIVRCLNYKQQIFY